MGNLSERISSDAFLVLTSLVVACVIWLIAKGNDLGQEMLRVPIVLVNKPANIIARLPVETAQVTATFAKSMQAHMTPANFQIEVDWNDLVDQRWCGIEEFAKSPPMPLEPRDVHPVLSLGQSLRERIQRRVTFMAIEPPKLSIEARFITRLAKVALETTGKPADGYFVSGPVEPASKDPIVLTAPLQRFIDLGAAEQTSAVLVSAEPVDLANRKASFSDTVRLRLPPDVELVNRDQQRIEVEVPVAEAIGQRVLEKIPIVVQSGDSDLSVEYGQKTASVCIQAPKRLLYLVKPGDIVVLASPSPRGGEEGESTVTLRASFANPSVSAEIVRSTRFLWVSPVLLRVAYTWRETPEESSIPTPIPTPTPKEGAGK